MPPSVNFSVTSLFLHVSGVVEGVLVLLALMSVLCWALIIEKSVTLIGLRRQLRLLERASREGETAPVRRERPGSLTRAVLDEGDNEWGIEKPGESITHRGERAERAMRDTMVSHLIRAESRLHYLATISSAAPFVGLFGTVWGIMHAFTGIAQSGDTGLSTVAPGIAEALSTTAFGLAAAIPAAVGYNKMASDFATLARRLNLAIARLARRFGHAQSRKVAE